MTPADVPVAGPFLALGVGVALVVLAIARWRVHPFFALMLAAMAVGVVVAAGGFGKLTLIDAIERPVVELGVAAGKIALVIAMAAVIGECLTVSGGAERIVQGLLRAWGEQRAGLALLAGGLVLAIPVFFDTVFLLLLPLARALAVRTGRDYLFYVMAMCTGAVIAHGTIPPTPGPLIVAELMGVNLAVAIGGGILCSLLPAAGGLWFSRWIGRRVVVPPPVRTAAEAAQAERPLPPLGLALLPVVLPLALIGAAAGAAAWAPAGSPAAGEAWAQTLAFLGNKHVALGAGLLAALVLAGRRRAADTPSLADLLGRPLEAAGAIILITAAGGAFGAMLREAGLGPAVTALAEGREVNFVVLGWLLAAVVRVAQGSATVAMITAAGMLTAAAGDQGWGCHPFWVFLAVGYGGMTFSWANDSGFWLVSRMCGWDTATTFRSWTMLLTVISLLGLVQAWVLAAIF